MEISDTLNKELPIGTKSIDDVELFLKEHDHIVEVFKALCLAQIENECDSRPSTIGGPDWWTHRKTIRIPQRSLA